LPIPQDYEDRVYAGVLGKIIGVYVGRPFEGWRYERIQRELGDVDYYVHDQLGKPLIVADDDISGTFTFVRALVDHGISRDITPRQIGQTWLNYLIEERTILWWGGMGTSTEHTAYLRLKHGTSAPDSGSMARNGKVVAEQIGAQIFIDGWALVCPGEPELAADLAERAARVSHDGEAVYGAQALAAMEAAAFYERDIGRLLDIGTGVIPRDSTIAGLVSDVRDWHAKDGDWRETYGRISRKYGYDKYGGGCHMVPNHALIVLALLYGDGDFQRSMMVVNTAGWDTDCNSGNVGCLMGIRGGLEGIDAGPDWRGPVADRLYKISADGGDGLTDAAREALRLCRVGRALLGARPRPAPKDGARFHFSFPGSVQGFMPDPAPECRDACTVTNAPGHSGAGDRKLAIHYTKIAPGRPARAGVQVYPEPDELLRPGYRMVLSPSLYPGQELEAHVELSGDAESPISVCPYVQIYPDSPGSEMQVVRGPEVPMDPGAQADIAWRIPYTGGLPIVRTGVECRADTGTSGTLYLDALSWRGVATGLLSGEGLAAHGTPLGWTDGVDRVRVSRAANGSQLELIHDEGRGMLIGGTGEWEQYRLSARVSPHLSEEAGIAARVGGMRRFYALLLCRSGKVRLLRCRDDDTVLAEVDMPWEFGEPRDLCLCVEGNRIRAQVDGDEVFDVTDAELRSGGGALVVTEGRTAFTDVTVEPL